MVALLIGMFDICCISVSYCMIIWAVVSLSSADAQLKAFSTCIAHISAIIITYVPAFFTFFTHHFGEHILPPSLHIIMTNLHLLLLPTLNPIIYGVKTKQIWECHKALPGWKRCKYLGQLKLDERWIKNNKEETHKWHPTFTHGWYHYFFSITSFNQVIDMGSLQLSSNVFI